MPAHSSVASFSEGCSECLRPHKRTRRERVRDLIRQGYVDRTITPVQFGAACDGIADDTVALQRAVTAAIVQGKILDLARGTCKVSGSITGSGDICIVNSGGAVIEMGRGEYERFGVVAFSGRATRVGRLSASVEDVAVIGVDLAKSLFRSTESMGRGRSPHVR